MATEHDPAYVVAWEFNTGGGYNWYFSKRDADKAWEQEMQICKEMKAENWSAFFIVVKVGQVAFGGVKADRLIAKMIDENRFEKSAGPGMTAINKHNEGV